MKLAARGASMRCGGSYALPFVREVVLSWWTAIFSQGCRVQDESLVRCSPGRQRLRLRMSDDGILYIVTTVVASFSEYCLCGVAVGLVAFGHA
uniref:Uncharacterized protein n=1 Tax=Oryza glumipatula TaxID=40148 RepID=A0A0D9YAM7_9ORYZ